MVMFLNVNSFTVFYIDISIITSEQSCVTHDVTICCSTMHITVISHGVRTSLESESHGN